MQKVVRLIVIELQLEPGCALVDAAIFLNILPDQPEFLRPVGILGKEFSLFAATSLIQSLLLPNITCKMIKSLNNSPSTKI